MKYVHKNNQRIKRYSSYTEAERSMWTYDDYLRLYNNFLNWPTGVDISAPLYK